ncbi:hypothetical protein PHSY_000842 [Pseudozyma hubeiensis SY62]|uniref:Uncharacterized protein n=1 Tax=Pseudozyma hubeiensis (strain SY62) TaxID=1305764 RepID=R9NX95_PSEHS|nr:hypothetical protein PHSY_000842 [Pseudozyma hubeiensis SY62]GAC93278.1 hypothetical protein PHSY_000842 [Pseudozyma hubeiensis SY62]
MAWSSTLHLWHPAVFASSERSTGTFGAAPLHETWRKEKKSKNCPSQSRVLFEFVLVAILASSLPFATVNPESPD